MNLSMFNNSLEAWLTSKNSKNDYDISLNPRLRLLGFSQRLKKKRKISITRVIALNERLLILNVLEILSHRVIAYVKLHILKVSIINSVHSEVFSKYSKTWENNKINIYKTEKASDFNYLYFVLYSLNLYGKESILNVSIQLRYFIKELFLKYLKSFIFSNSFLINIEKNDFFLLWVTVLLKVTFS